MPRFTGLIDAVMTPFNAEGEVNEKAFREIIDFQLDGGLHGLFVCGGGGEGVYMNLAERKRVAEVALDHARDRSHVIVHVGAVATRDVVELAQHAEANGAHAVAALPPFIFAKDPDTVVAYFAQIVEAVDIPVLAYHLPVVTGVEIYADLMERLYHEAGTAGMKFTDHNLLAMQEILDRVGEDMEFLYGRDEQIIAGLLMGAPGGVGSTYNVMPNLFGQLWRQWEARQVDAAAATQHTINRIISVLCELGGIRACKEALNLLGFDCGQPRSPIRPVSEAESGALREKLDKVGYFDLVRRQG